MLWSYIFQAFLALSQAQLVPEDPSIFSEDEVVVGETDSRSSKSIKTLNTKGEKAGLGNDAEFFENLDTYYDPEVDYSRFFGRVSDRDKSTSILKIQTENINTRLLSAGDQMEFTVSRLEGKKPCTGYVRDVEENFLILFVKDLYPCWGGADNYFRRGTQLNFRAPVLAQRVKDASIYRVLLMKRKRDFLRQLNDINHFVWSYDQIRVQTASDYDRRIAELEKNKGRALDNLAIKKRDQIHLQRELKFRLDKLDKDIEFYRIEKIELLKDRWSMDLDLGLPVDNRPQRAKPKYRENQ
jgi:hypothetical protein